MIPAENKAGRLRRRLWRERAVFVVLLGAGVAYYYLAIRGVGGPCLIALDGQPVVVVKNRAVANRVLNEIKREAGEAEGLKFLQQVTFHHVAAEGNRIVSDVEAMRVLSPRLTLVVNGAGVFANDRLVFGLPNQQEAMRALSHLLKELSPPDPELTRAFRERVRVRDTPVPLSLFLPSADGVMDKVRAQTAPRGVHVVQRGESAWVISGKYHVSLEALAYANPNLDLKLLHAEDRITLPGEGPPLTVISWKEVEEPIRSGPFAGKTQTVRIAYENGRQVERVVIRRPRREEPRRPETRHAARKPRSRPAVPRQNPQEAAPAPAQITGKLAPASPDDPPSENNTTP